MPHSARFAQVARRGPEVAPRAPLVPPKVAAPAASKVQAGAAAPADLLARARLLGHHVQRFAPLGAAVHAAPGGAIQRVFGLEEARAFLRDNPPVWKAKKPANLLTAYRATRGILPKLKKDTDWETDPEAETNLATALDEAWEAREAERIAAERAAAKLKAESDARKRVTEPLKKHVLKGDFETGKDVPTGFHSIRGESTTHEAYGTKTDIANGVYQQSVKGMKDSTWKKKPIQSTFFPDTVGDHAATADEVVVALGTAIGSSAKRVQYPEEWAGITLVKKGETWYPTGGSDTRMAEDLE